MRTEANIVVKTELLILLGRSAKGIWSVETLEGDASGEIYSNLVCTTIEGKRRVFPVIKGLSEVTASSLGYLALRRLRQLAKGGQWDVGSLTPVELSSVVKPPALVYREKGKAAYERARAAAEQRLRNANTWENIRALTSLGYVWTLNVRGRDGRLVQIERGSHCDNGNFGGAKCFGGVTDDANGEFWWILVKHTASDNCFATWHSIRLPRGVSVK